MGNKFLPIEIFSNKVWKAYRFFQYRVIRLERLLYGRGNDLIQTLNLRLFTLRTLADNERYLVDAYLGGLFQEPLQPLNIFCWGDGDMQVMVAFAIFSKCRIDLQDGALWVCVHYFCLVQAAFAIYQLHLIANSKAKHSNSMLALFF